ncbi:hypothetical protein ACJX0J_024579, partial [Zea mays]
FLIVSFSNYTFESYLSTAMPFLQLNSEFAYIFKYLTSHNTDIWLGSLSGSRVVEQKNLEAAKKRAQYALYNFRAHVSDQITSEFSYICDIYAVGQVNLKGFFNTL